MTLNTSTLVDRNVPFFHAMNLQGFVAYLRSRAVCSREVLLRDPNAAPFPSDDADRKRALLGRVFGNPCDLGRVFANSERNLACPNIYGPVQLRFAPSVWEDLSDVVVTKKSVMSLGDDWRSDAVAAEELVEEIDRVESQFGGVTTHEASAANGSIGLEKCTGIIVEPLSIFGVPLVAAVRNLVEVAKLDIPVQKRVYKLADNKQRIRSEAEALLAHVGLDDDGKRLVYDPRRDWMREASSRVVDFWGQWATHFYRGTVKYVRNNPCWATTLDAFEPLPFAEQDR